MAATLPAICMEPYELAVAGYLARYREPTLSAYRRDLRCFWQRCAYHQLKPLAAKPAHLELYLRYLEHRGYAGATVSRRMSTVAGLFRYAIIDELVTAGPDHGSHPAPGTVGGQGYPNVLGVVHALAADAATRWVPALGAEDERGSEVAERPRPCWAAPCG